MDGGSSGGDNTISGAIFIENGSSNIHVEGNQFQNNFNQTDIYIYNSDNIYFRGNVSGPNEYQPVSAHVTDSTIHSNLYITDNIMSGFIRMGAEIQDNSGSGSGFGGVHVDRNSIEQSSNAGDNMAISLVPGAANSCNTVWGNTLTTTTPDTGQWGIEIGVLGPASTDIEQNTITDVGAPFFIAPAVATAIQNNTLTNWGNSFGDGPFNEDGGYNNTQWVGINTLNGTQTAGWAGHANKGFQPAACSPSTSFP
jgi:hypothetical protein